MVYGAIESETGRRTEKTWVIVIDRIGAERTKVEEGIGTGLLRQWWQEID